MELLQHDGRVRIGGLALTEAELRALKPTFPHLPSGIVTRRYDGIRHILSDGATQRRGPVPWAPGDALLADAALAAGLDALRTRPAPRPASIAEARRKRESEIDYMVTSRIAAGFRHTDGVVYDGDTLAQNTIAAILAQIAAGLGLPGGGATFTYWDATENPRHFDEAGFRDFARAMRDRLQRIYLAADAQRKAIKAIASDTTRPRQARIDAIETQDIAAGWPA